MMFKKAEAPYDLSDGFLEELEMMTDEEWASMRLAEMEAEERELREVGMRMLILLESQLDDAALSEYLNKTVSCCNFED